MGRDKVVQITIRAISLFVIENLHARIHVLLCLKEFTHVGDYILRLISIGYFTLRDSDSTSLTSMKGHLYNSMRLLFTRSFSRTHPSCIAFNK